jgi:hypothetical protein
MDSAYEILLNNKEINYVLNNVNYNMNRSINFANGTSDINYCVCCHGLNGTLISIHPNT